MKIATLCYFSVVLRGAFILLDILLEQMRHEKAVDVFGAVSRLRSQRNFMVQTEDQYAFVYEALVEAAASGNTELSVRQLSAHWARLIKTDSTVIREFTSEENPCTTGLELEFTQLVAQTQISHVTLYLSRANVGLLSPIDPFSGHDEERLQTGLTTTTVSGPVSPRFVSSESGTLKPNAALARVSQIYSRTKTEIHGTCD
ncbi:unnamed protein product [Echinostoma caproni]|uniref:Ras-GEF domain-containing protein n=1 Tax=Echinostoma caproni TaxID=27848 RepID=A0A183BEE0_9TREM|nr:unnamed protein product [Echinostoma caproni]